MEKRIMALILASVLTLGAVLTGCSTNAESSSPDISSQSSVPEGSAPEDSEETGHSEAPEESGESQTAPVTPESGSSGESVVYENPDTDPDMTAEELAEIERLRTAWALREYLEETVSAESYAYLNPGDGILTIGVIDADGNVLSGVTATVEGNIAAGTPEQKTESELKITLKSSDTEALHRLDGLKYRVSAKTTAAVAGTTLNENQTLKLDDIRIQIKGGVTLDMN